ncbi:unnamed protein product [Citrullus colocynthis]|uniref:Uncharacterized protein n=1 Tax=Citrullus colocynthis TaxID=252529 RepID=A0ABP0YD72_9ROSI
MDHFCRNLIAFMGVDAIVATFELLESPIGPLQNGATAGIFDIQMPVSAAEFGSAATSLSCHFPLFDSDDLTQSAQLDSLRGNRVDSKANKACECRWNQDAGETTGNVLRGLIIPSHSSH